MRPRSVDKSAWFFLYVVPMPYTGRRRPGMVGGGAGLARPRPVAAHENELA